METWRSVWKLCFRAFRTGKMQPRHTYTESSATFRVDCQLRRDVCMRTQIRNQPIVPSAFTSFSLFPGVALYTLFQDGKGIQSFLADCVKSNLKKISSDILSIFLFLLETYRSSLESYVVVIKVCQSCLLLCHFDITSEIVSFCRMNACCSLEETVHLPMKRPSRLRC